MGREENYISDKTIKLNMFAHHYYPLILEWDRGKFEMKKLEDVLKKIDGIHCSQSKSSVNNVFHNIQIHLKINFIVKILILRTD